LKAPLFVLVSIATEPLLHYEMCIWDRKIHVRFLKICNFRQCWN